MLFCCFLQNNTIVCFNQSLVQFIKGLISVWDNWFKTKQAGYKTTHNTLDASKFLHDLPKALTVLGPDAANVEPGTPFQRQLSQLCFALLDILLRAFARFYLWLEFIYRYS